MTGSAAPGGSSSAGAPAAPGGAAPDGAAPDGAAPDGAAVLGEYECARAWSALTAAHARVAGRLAAELARSVQLTINDFEILVRPTSRTACASAT